MHGGVWYVQLGHCHAREMHTSGVRRSGARNPIRRAADPARGVDSTTSPSAPRRSNHVGGVVSPTVDTPATSRGWRPYAPSSTYTYPPPLDPVAVSHHKGPSCSLASYICSLLENFPGAAPSVVEGKGVGDDGGGMAVGEGHREAHVPFSSTPVRVVERGWVEKLTKDKSRP